tara:strand:- start:364 stop:1083 length:720 start_codon:yes stop_codon:yes gene_type:complete
MINIDEVYQKVLALANKEQRGYITPQEFNLYANQAQKDVFNQYFFDLSQYKRVPSVDTYYSNIDDIIDYKISYFKTTDVFVADQGYTMSLGDSNGDDAAYIITNVGFIDANTNLIHNAQRIKFEDFSKTNKSPLTRGTYSFPNYATTSENAVIVFPQDATTNVSISYIRTPKKPNWQYVVVNEKPLFDESGAVHFELHPSEQKNLIVKILQFAGVGIKDYNIVQAASQEEVKKIQQEKS